MYHYNLGLLFEEVAGAYAQHCALRYPAKNISYAALHGMAQALAVQLLQQGCQQGDVIAIAHTKQPQSYALMLAGLMLGVPYVNIDVASPLARSLRIVQTSDAKFLFCDDAASALAMQELARHHGCPLHRLDLEVPALPSESELLALRERIRTVDGATLGYIMFTSGSTGIPKGVAVTHQNILHFIQWGQQCFSVVPDDIFANLSPMYFDNSVFDFYTALFSGASLAPVSRELLTEPLRLVEYVESMHCTIWFCVPSLLIYLMTMKVLTAQRLPTVRSFSFGGEGYPKVELKKLYDAFSPRVRLVNVYGPTECTCICSAHELSDTDFADMEGLPMLGNLNQNFDYLILDEEGKSAASGELCLIGPNVAAGYFNDPERSNAAFITLTTPERYMKRMYRTGDIVREEGGKLYFVGRKDNQIKHMGYRIELEEIENALMRLPHVTQAAVVYRRESTAYGRLLAFVATEAATDARSIAKNLETLLPQYMIPGKITIMAALPKNANGKVDRQALKNVV